MVPGGGWYSGPVQTGLLSAQAGVCPHPLQLQGPRPPREDSLASVLPARGHCRLATAVLVDPQSRELGPTWLPVMALQGLLHAGSCRGPRMYFAFRHAISALLAGQRNREALLCCPGEAAHV
ncbi:hypothetical protein NDU88_004153 [Pleurodeles waltl]|uniref:Uncharacterized protein n=1 Tax=Pleurodeles waltl TaxID=8319 RepID=A0AAV7WU96_PLEWA|nr:hypothetical protein NDU88_004153 [Pleurodeles waltl]